MGVQDKENQKNNKDPVNNKSRSESFGPTEGQLLKLTIETILENGGEAGRRWIVSRLEEKFGKETIDRLRQELLIGDNSRP